MYLKRNKHYLLSAALIAGAILSVPVVQASTSFTSSALLTYTINSITNNNSEHPSDLSGLEISAYFAQSIETTDFYATTTGDGAVVANNPSVSLATITDTFSHDFSVSGNATNGSVDSLHTGLYGLIFNNIGTDSYAVNVSLGYQLASAVNGLLAINNIAVDYYTVTSSLSGFASIGSFTSVDALSDTQTLNNLFTPIAFTVAAGDIEHFAAKVAVTGNIEASAVPLPAATWLFLTGMIALLGLGKRKLVIGV